MQSSKTFPRTGVFSPRRRVHEGRPSCGGGSRGFTIVELMTVIAILAVVTTLALPSFARVIQGASVSSTVNAFLGDLRFARAEAVRRGGNVVLCRSDDPEAPSPACASGPGPASAGWATGWVVFHDLDRNGVRDASDPVLKVARPAPGIGSIADGGASTVYRFTPLGRLYTGIPTTELSFGGAAIRPEVRRTVCVFPTGTARVSSAPSGSCAG